MVTKIITFLAVFLITGALFLALPNNSEAGIMPPPPGFGCCQVQIIESGEFACFETNFSRCRNLIGQDFIGFFEDSECDEQTGFCSGFSVERNVPTLSEWGLIAMAGVLGLVGFMVMKRRKATA